MAKQHRTVVNDIEIAWVEWGTKGDPLILLAHATGFHSRCWDQTVSHLDAYHVIALDCRGHGRSDNSPPFTWSQFGADLTSLIVAMDLSDIRGVGHSMGGHCMVQAAVAEPDRFRQLTLLDPVILEPSVYAAGPVMAGIEHPVARRRNEWDSPQHMIDTFKDRAPFSGWHPEVLRDYCLHGLIHDGDTYRLACPPEIEAGIYASSVDANILDRIPDIEVPVTVVRAKSRGIKAALEDFSLSPTWPELAGQFVLGQDMYLPEFSHFMPMESPAQTASVIEGTYDLAAFNDIG